MYTKILNSKIVGSVSSGLRSHPRSLYARSSLVGLGAFVSDYVWARYMANVAEGHGFVAANWAVGVIVLGAYLVISYVEDKRLIFPAAIGAWIGTYLAV
jgi:hypothetical protein